MNYDSIKQQWRKRKAKVKALKAAGVSATVIALKLGITRQRVYQLLK